MSAALYHKQLMALAKRATGAGRLEEYDATARVDNPLCGDEITLDVTLADGHVETFGHRVRGCMLCEASASWMSEHGIGQDADEVARIFTALRALLREGELDNTDGLWPEIEVFAPVHAAKSRHRCVMLPLEALLEVLGESVPE